MYITHRHMYVSINSSRSYTSTLHYSSLKTMERKILYVTSLVVLIFVFTYSNAFSTAGSGGRKMGAPEKSGTATEGGTGSAHGPNWEYNWGWGSTPNSGWGYGSGSGRSPNGFGKGSGYGSGSGTGSGSGSGYGSGGGGGSSGHESGFGSGSGHSPHG